MDFRRSCRPQFVADSAVALILVTIQIVLFYLLWMKEHFFLPPELLIPAFIEAVLVTLLLQAACILQLSLTVWALCMFCAHACRSGRESASRDELPSVKELLLGALYIPLCLGGAFLAAAASRPFGTGPISGGTEVFLTILPYVFVVFAVLPAVYVVYHGSQSSLLRSPSLSDHILPFTLDSRPVAAGKLREERNLIIAGSILLPVYTAWAYVPYIPLTSYPDAPAPHAGPIPNLKNLMVLITRATVSLAAIGIAVLLCAMATQTLRRERYRARAQARRMGQ